MKKIGSEDISACFVMKSVLLNLAKQQTYVYGSHIYRENLLNRRQIYKHRRFRNLYLHDRI